MPWVSAPAATAVTARVCVASFAGRGRSLTSSDAGLIEVGRWPAAGNASGVATGASLTSPTSIVTVAGGDVASPSETANVNVSGPKKSARGVYTRSGAVPESVPLPGLSTTKVSGSPSGSLPPRLIGVGTSSTSSSDAASATGGWFGASRCTVTVPVEAHNASSTPSVVPSSHTA